MGEFRKTLCLHFDSVLQHRIILLDGTVMKKISLLLLTLLFSLLFSSCQNSPPEPLPLTLPFSSSVLIERGDRKNTYTLTFQGENCTLEDSVGYIFTCFSDHATLTSGEMILPFSVELLPDKGCLLKAFTCEETPLCTKLEKEDGDLEYCFPYVCEGTNYIFYVDPSGELLRLQVENADPLTVYFQNA